MKTFRAKTHEVKRDWCHIDASDKILGRLATEVARRLRGKHKAEYGPDVDVGDYIVVTNVEKLIVTGRKFKEKMYYHHTGHHGGIKSISFDKLQIKNPARILERAVKGMLPKNPLGRDMYRKLKIYVGAEHPHEAQQPKKLDIEE